MRPIRDLEFAFDAIEYTQRGNKDLFLQTFTRDHHCDDLLNRNKYFLIGEKGTGKTAYAVYFSNSDYGGVRASINTLSSTDYERFLRLKLDSKINVSSFSDIWRVILLLLVSQKLISIYSDTLLHWIKFRRLKEAIDRYYNNAFSPEISTAMTFAEDSKNSVKLVNKLLGIEMGQDTKYAGEQFQFQVHLHELEKRFKEALSDLRVPADYILFIDGIDRRPQGIEFGHYLECVRGLADAIWSLNSEYFANIRDTPGRVRIVLLTRPDIFNQFNLHNQNAKARDNSVFLNWFTRYEDYRSSGLFRLTKHMLSGQQNGRVDDDVVWEKYFPFRIRNEKTWAVTDNPFIHILRHSFYRPRDIMAHLWYVTDYCRKNNIDSAVYSVDMLERVRREYSNYLIGEMNDYLRFYYDRPYDDVVIEFFAFMRRKYTFSYENFSDAYKVFCEHWHEPTPLPEFCSTERKFLQFLFENNIICYRHRLQEGTFDHWAFRERGPTMMSPKVPPHQDYAVHAGLRSGLNLAGVFVLHGA